MAFQARKEILALCDVIDRHFIFEVGPFGEFLVEETREKWLASGNKMTAGHVIGYIDLLAAQIAEAPKRDSFQGKARASLFTMPAAG